MPGYLYIYMYSYTVSESNKKELPSTTLYIRESCMNKCVYTVQRCAILNQLDSRDQYMNIHSNLPSLDSIGQFAEFHTLNKKKTMLRNRTLSRIFPISIEFPSFICQILMSLEFKIRNVLSYISYQQTSPDGSLVSLKN